MSSAPEPLVVPVAVQRRPIREIVAYFLRLGTLGFGGPVALCGLMEKELVGEKGWLTKEEMRDAIAVRKPCPARWRSRLASSSPICAAVFGRLGRGLGLYPA
jgi:hypothetical protein